MSHSNIICLVALLSLFTVLQAFPKNTYYRPRAQPHSEFKELREQMESQSDEVMYPKRLEQFNSKFPYPQNQQALVQQVQARIDNSMADAQRLTIAQNCVGGDIVEFVINTALSSIAIFRTGINIDINCDVYGNGECVAVTVEVGGTIQADVDVCVRSSMLFYKFHLID